MAKHRLRAFYNSAYAGVLLCLTIILAQPWGLIAADTKHDLTANPLQFLWRASFAYNDVFTFGQVQNQAYGYMFPHGAFFALGSVLGSPSWVTQRLWWSLVTIVGFVGMRMLLSRIGVRSSWLLTLASLLYVFSPHTLSTLTTISSETWPMMLTPWILISLIGVVGQTRSWQHIWRSVIPIGLLGAINATATLAAIIPAGLYFLYSLLTASSVAQLRRGLAELCVWMVASITISLWWIVPLLQFRTVSPPFTDFIENGTTTTTWFHLAEILRGTTHWVPFVDTERIAGHELLTNPWLIIATFGIATISLYGLGTLRTKALIDAHFWIFLFGLGICCLAAAHQFPTWLDSGIGVAFRNLHKLDAWIRLPLMIGLASLGGMRVDAGAERVGAGTELGAGSAQAGAAPAVPGAASNPPRTPQYHQWAWHWEHESGPARQRRQAAIGMLLVLGMAAMAPAWSFRLLPQGAYQAVSQDWQRVADYVNTHARGTRTLILPAARFARQDWGWTRDEPAQALFDVPWAVRDAIPLVDPETIRGLDGLSQFPTEANLLRHGIGAVVIRHDLVQQELPLQDVELHPIAHTRFGELEVLLLDPTYELSIVDASAVTSVAGGGEVLSFLPSGEYQFVQENATIVTDTPLAQARNYGSLTGGSGVVPADAVQAHTQDVHNRVPDYPTTSPIVGIREYGVRLKVSSSGADATNFPRPDPNHGAHGMIDDNPTTAWYPAFGAQDGATATFEFPTQLHTPRLRLKIVAANYQPDSATTLYIDTGHGHMSQLVRAGEDYEFVLPGSNIQTLSLSLGASATPIGIDNVTIEHHPMRATVHVTSSAHTRAFIFQRHSVATTLLQREFELHRPMQLDIEASRCTNAVVINQVSYRCGATVSLEAGVHRLESYAPRVELREHDFSLIGKSTPIPAIHEPASSFFDTPSITQAQITAADHLRYLNVHRSASPGLSGTLNDIPLEPVTLNAGMQAFAIPAGTQGQFRLEFRHADAYRYSLGFGLLLAVAQLALMCAVVLRSRTKLFDATTSPSSSQPTNALAIGISLLPFILASVLTVQWWILPILLVVVLTRAVTVFSRAFFVGAAGFLIALWCARAPWPTPHYAAASMLVEVWCIALCWWAFMPARYEMRRAAREYLPPPQSSASAQFPE
ncbi:DUF3367 domain-containing protein [Corynebacterium sp. HS2168-gen11]|uniref:DUF3367 domain-containing protein n=1 Tax=Corynebacterium sp. HS2168-gen11 TaxID=2974027 RepID=UPI00216B09C8|nr:DUF3367 domain-containing protein [Corynebacterium sp. HS2168-gen11]MCS4535997.1 DUF3367 domain-containing protein [Corynebacterium sp. HS2168-gen11]